MTDLYEKHDGYIQQTDLFLELIETKAKLAQSEAIVDGLKHEIREAHAKIAKAIKAINHLTQQRNRLMRVTEIETANSELEKILGER